MKLSNAMISSFDNILSNSLKLVNLGDTNLLSPVQRYLRDLSLPSRTKLTLDWADHRQRQKVIELVERMGRQTVHLRSCPEAKLAIIRFPDGELVGWAGMDAEARPDRPTLFSHFVYPQYRDLKLDRLLEHVWWAYLSAWGCKIGYLSLEQGNNKRLLRHRVTTEYCPQLTEHSKSKRLKDACRNCDLYYCDGKGQTYYAIDVEKALSASVSSMRKLDICKFPIHFRVKMLPETHEETGQLNSTSIHNLPNPIQSGNLP
jgi:hypothetical protein